MSTSPTVPMFAPDGSVRDVPYEQMHAALDAGGKLGVYMKDPQGTQHVVPGDQVQAAQKAGGTIVPYNLDATHQNDGFWKSAGSDILGMVKGLPSAVQGMFNPGAGARMAAPMMAHDQARAASGAGLPYRAAAAVGEAAGVNVPGMEQAAAQGDQAGVMGHAVAGAAPYVAAPVAGDVIRKVGPDVQAAMRSTAQRAYQSALKPSTTMGQQRVNAAVNTGLANEIPISEQGAQRLSQLIGDFQQRVKDVISSQPGASINKFSVASRLGDTVNKFAKQVTPEADLQQISNMGQEFLNNQPGQIAASTAQEIKQGTYQQLKGKAYGELKTASIEAQKALARGIKEELEAQFPELKQLNAQQGELFNLEKPLERALDRIGNHDIIGLGSPVAGAAVGGALKSGPAGATAFVLKSAIDNPAVKSRLAIALSKGSKGSLAPAAAFAKISAYSAALGTAANSSESDARSSQIQP